MMTRDHFLLDDDYYDDHLVSLCICYDYICGLTAICMCIMITFVSAKDSCIKTVQIQNKYAKKITKKTT